MSWYRRRAAGQSSSSSGGRQPELTKLNVGAFIVRIGFGVPYTISIKKYNKEPPEIV